LTEQQSRVSWGHEQGLNPQDQSRADDVAGSRVDQLIGEDHVARAIWWGDSIWMVSIKG
jgi:hypothetical protein